MLFYLSVYLPATEEKHQNTRKYIFPHTIKKIFHLQEFCRQYCKQLALTKKKQTITEATTTTRLNSEEKIGTEVNLSPFITWGNFDWEQLWNLVVGEGRRKTGKNEVKLFASGNALVMGSPPCVQGGWWRVMSPSVPQWCFPSPRTRVASNRR